MPTIDLGYVIGPQGPQGTRGATGAQGVQGNPGPNQVTGSTSTTLNGILQGNGSVVSALPTDSTPSSGSNNIVRSGALYSEFARHARPNLLDNWFFVGGGGADGTFPIAQKSWDGITNSYTGIGYFIDRWYGYSSGQVVTLQTGGVRLYNADATAYLQQYLEPFIVPVPTTVTFSVLYRGNARLYDNLSGSTRNTAWTDTSGDIGLLKLTTTIPANTVMSNPHVWIATPVASELIIYAAKLEVGNTSTLAIQDGNNWVLCDLPDYTVELAKCQRHMLILNPLKTSNLSFAIGYAYNATTAYCIINTPVSLRAVPTVSATGTLTIQNSSTKINVSAVSFFRRTTNSTTVSVTASGLTASAFYFLGCGSDGALLTLDANIYP